MRTPDASVDYLSYVLSGALLERAFCKYHFVEIMDDHY